MSTDENSLPRIDMKYHRLREECAKLLEIAKELEISANKNIAFATNNCFNESKARFRNQVQTVAALAGSVV
jgi:hypothetical protein